MSSIQFSVLMCVYKNDNSSYFKIALESILNQTIRPTEIILVIDGPIPKETRDIINDTSLNNKEIFNFIDLKENVGHGRAKNIGLEKCTNELVAIMDSDDVCTKDRFEKQILYYKQNPETSILGGLISEFNKNINNPLGKRVLPSTHSEIKRYLKMRCPMNHMTVMFKKSKVIEAGGYLDWHYNEDYYLWIRMYLSGAIFANLNDVIVHARVNDKFYLRRGGWRYFVSESKLQYYMFQKNIINIFRLTFNIKIRFFVQFVIPNKFREWLFLNFFRK
tara:strand:+ start:3972 stop:4799 length:828 start_codon:yes stop_codon:yes gene_type:complete